MPVRLTVHRANQPARTHFLRDAGSYTLGRDPACEVVLDDPRVSRRHARLEIASGAARVVDLGSKNGVTVNGLAIEDAPLPTDGWLGIGGLIVRCEYGPQVLPPAEEERELRQAALAGHQAISEAGSEVSLLLDRLLTKFLEVSQTARGFVLLTNAGGDYSVVACRALTPRDMTESSFSGSLSAVQQVLLAARPIVESDVREHADLGHRASIVREEICALVCVPLVAAEKTLGAVYADSQTVGKAFRELDIEILSALAEHAALAIWLAGLKDELSGVAAALPTRIDRGGQTAHSLTGFPSWSVIAGSSGENAHE